MSDGRTAAATYRNQAVLTASPEKLVRLLYERTIRELTKSKVGMADPATRTSEGVGQSLGSAMSLISELRTALDHQKGGEISRNLDALYDFALDQISQANISRSPEHVDAALGVMQILKEGWDAILPS